MAFSSAKLIRFSCFAFVVLLASLAGARASTCVPSPATAKSDEHKVTWPSWAMRALNRDVTPPSRDGVKCWRPRTHATSYRHRFRSRLAHRRNPIEPPATVLAAIDSRPSRIPAAPPSETSGTGWSAPASAEPIAPAAPAQPIASAQPSGQNSFAERFAAVFELIFFEQTPLMRRMEDLYAKVQ